MKKKLSLIVVLVLVALAIFTACGAPVSKNEEIENAYVAAGYQKNPVGTESAAAAFSNLGSEYKVTYFAKGLGTANVQMFILFKCKTTKEANDIEKTYGTYTIKKNGVDVMLFFIGTADTAPWDSVF